MATFPGSAPSGTVTVDPATGFLLSGGSILVDTSVAGIVNLPSAVTYDGQSLVVKNPAGNTTNYFPVDMYAMNSRWYIKGGKSLLTLGYPRRRHCWPGAAWNNGTFTMTSAAFGAQTTVDSSPTTNLHALTQANQVTAGATYVYVSGSVPATGTVDWTVGWTLIADIPNTHALTLVHPYDANLKVPIIDDVGVESEAFRILVPPLSITGGLNAFVVTKNSNGGAVEHRTRVRYGAHGAAVASCTELLGSNDTSLQTVTFRTGFQNAGGNTVQIGLGSTADIDGWGVGSTTYALPTIDNSAAVTDAIITLSAAAGPDCTIETVAYSFDWWY